MTVRGSGRECCVGNDGLPIQQSGAMYISIP